MFLRGQPFDEARRPAVESDHAPAVALDFVNPAEQLAVERPHFRVAQVRQADHSAPRRGIHARTLFSTEWSLSSSAVQLR
jgi:hypothetical protein